MKNSFYISIKGFGDFGMTRAEKKKRESKIKLNAQRLAQRRKKITKKVMVDKGLERRLKKVNNYRATKNMKPLSKKDFITITRKRKPRKLKKISNFNYTFEVLDTLENLK